jgi:hypothetical protein
MENTTNTELPASPPLPAPTGSGFVWQPWETFKEEPAVLNIPAPPCQHCRYWKPQRQYMSIEKVGIIFDGVRLCHSEEQQRDFSCFRPNDQAHA